MKEKTLSTEEFRNRYNYANRESLGRGGFGHVFKVWDSQRHVFVALKRGDGNVIKGKTQSMLASEVEVALNLPPHRNVIQYENYFKVAFEFETAEFARLPYFEAGNLKDFLDSNPNFEQRVNIIRELAEGLAHLHKNGIIHRDLKPANVLLATDPTGKTTPLIADFGLGKVALGDGTHFTQSFQGGTAIYGAMEQLLGERTGYPADIWSWGVIAWELLTGSHPYTPNIIDAPELSVIRAIKIIQNFNPSIKNLLSLSLGPTTTEMGNIIIKSLQQSPKDRFRDGQALVNDLGKKTNRDQFTRKKQEYILPNTTRRSENLTLESIGGSEKRPSTIPDPNQRVSGRLIQTELDSESMRHDSQSKSPPPSTVNYHSLKVWGLAGLILFTLLLVFKNVEFSSVPVDPGSMISEIEADDLEVENALWQQAMSADNFDFYQLFLDSFPNSKHAERATYRMTKIAMQIETEEEVWSAAQKEHSFKSYAEYLEVYPEGQYAEKAIIVLEDLKKNNVYSSAQKKIISEIEEQMVKIPKGTFIMGCSSGAKDDCYGADKPAHSVSVGTFYLSKFEITQAQWFSIMNKNSSEISSCDNCPVEGVSWVAVQDFISKLNNISGKNYRLPTEAEWEYAARGGEDYIHSGSNDLTSVAWCLQNSSRRSHEVGQKAPNSFGIYDMTGNVEEWCSDWYKGYPGSSGVTNDDGKTRVYRGGKYDSGLKSNPTVMRFSRRKHTYPNSDLNRGIGFRLAQQ